MNYVKWRGAHGFLGGLEPKKQKIARKMGITLKIPYNYYSQLFEDQYDWGE